MEAPSSFSDHWMDLQHSIPFLNLRPRHVNTLLPTDQPPTKKLFCARYVDYTLFIFVAAYPLLGTS